MEAAPGGEEMGSVRVLGSDDAAEADSNFGDDDMLVFLEAEMFEEAGSEFSVISTEDGFEETDAVKDTCFDLSQWIGCVEDKEKSDRDVDWSGWEGTAGLLDTGRKIICSGVGGEGPFRAGHEPVALTEEWRDGEFSIFPKTSMKNSLRRFY